MYPRLIWEESGRAISLCLPLSCSLSCSLSSPTISSLLSFLHSFTLFSPAAAFLPPLTFWHFLLQVLFACLSPLFSLCPLTFLLWVFPPPLFFLSWHCFLFLFQLSLPFSSLFSLIWTPFSDPLPLHLTSSPAFPLLPLPPSPGFRCSRDFSPSLFQAPPPHSPLSIIINDKG